MKEKIEQLIDELDEVLMRSHMTEEAYDYLMNVKDKLNRIYDNEDYIDLPNLIDLEKY